MFEEKKLSFELTYLGAFIDYLDLYKKLKEVDQLKDDFISMASHVLPTKEKGLNISFDKTKIENNQYINVDAERLKQILVNLIGNAVKYTNKGEIIVKQYQEKGRLCIMVSDTGIGMTEEEKARLFEKFYRIRIEGRKIRGGQA